jgi:hypothetical protein
LTSIPSLIKVSKVETSPVLAALIKSFIGFFLSFLLPCD